MLISVVYHSQLVLLFPLLLVYVSICPSSFNSFLDFDVFYISSSFSVWLFSFRITISLHFCSPFKRFLFYPPFCISFPFSISFSIASSVYLFPLRFKFAFSLSCSISFTFPLLSLTVSFPFPSHLSPLRCPLFFFSLLSLSFLSSLYLCIFSGFSLSFLPFAFVFICFLSPSLFL